MLIRPYYPSRFFIPPPQRRRRAYLQNTMSTLLKDLYSEAFFERFATALAAILPQFKKSDFFARIFNAQWQEKTLKERMRQTTEALHTVLSPDFEQAAAQIEKLIAFLQKNGEKNGALPYIFLPDYVELYGMEHLQRSALAMERITEFISCEFAVRPFILRYGNAMIAYMQAWSRHKNEHVRRLASEGVRPRLPWAIALPVFKRNPEPILPILEALKADESEYVRRSVANCLNDIAKDHPQTLLSIAQRWRGQSVQTDKLLKHACRNLLKQGEPTALALFGLQSSENIAVSGFRLSTDKLKMGERVNFSFSLHNAGGSAQDLRIEYAMYFLRQNGGYGKKVFKISERPLNANEKAEIQRYYSFRPITTRKYYAGIQRIALLVNGEQKAEAQFYLQD